jgi:hypothetical protein
MKMDPVSSSGGYLACSSLYQAQRRARPLARRRASTWRPFLVAMRARKPWVRARFKLLGWNVRFMAVPENWQFVVIQSIPGLLMAVPEKEARIL